MTRLLERAWGRSHRRNGTPLFLYLPALGTTKRTRGELQQMRTGEEPTGGEIPYYLPTDQPGAANRADSPHGNPVLVPSANAGQEFCDRETTAAFLKRKAFWNPVRRIMFSETQGIPVPVLMLPYTDARHLFCVHAHYFATEVCGIPYCRNHCC